MAERRRREERDPKPMGELMRMLVVGRGWGERMALGRLRDAWTEIAGEQLATRSEPALLVRGVLTLRVEPGAWASETTLLAPALARKAEAFLGPGSVTEVRVTSGSPNGRSEAHSDVASESEKRPFTC